MRGPSNGPSMHPGETAVFLSVLVVLVMVARRHAVGGLKAPVSLGYDARYASVHIEHDHHGQKEATNGREDDVRRVHVVGALFVELQGVPGSRKAAEERRTRYRSRHYPYDHDHQACQPFTATTSAVYERLRYSQVPVTIKVNNCLSLS